MRFAIVAAAVALGAVALAFVPSACSDRIFFAPAEGFAYHEPEARYEALFPYYVELCAISQFRSEELGVGGSPGHAVMYLKGACRDTDAPYPKLRRCARNATDPNDPEHGAGISVNRWFRNVNWVAVSRARACSSTARSRARRGGDARALRRRSRATRSTTGVFRGIELWPYPASRHRTRRSSTSSTRRAPAPTSRCATRARRCAAGVPVEPEMMDEIIHFLNDLNREYATGAVDFDWNGYHDNCVHTLRNALAAASMWRADLGAGHASCASSSTWRCPPNEAINLAALGTMGPIDSYPAIFGDDSMRHAMLEFGWLPTRHGGCWCRCRFTPRTSCSIREPRLLIFQGPATMRTTRRLLKMLDDPRFTELEPNLAHFEQLYREILAREGGRDPFAALWGDRYRRVRRRYFALIESELAEVERMRSAPAARARGASDAAGTPLATR